MLTIDARCTMRDCGNKNIYRMIGSCRNCGTGDILLLLTEGHPKPSDSSGQQCPVCGCREVRASRLATEDEIPVA